MSRSSDKRRDYNTYRAELIGLQQDAHAKFDKAVFWFASAGLGFSMAFYKEFAGTHAKHMCVLVISWVMFALAVLATTLSFLLTARVASKVLKAWDEHDHEGDLPFTTRPDNGQIEFCNVAAGASVALAVVFTLLFATTNV